MSHVGRLESTPSGCPHRTRDDCRESGPRLYNVAEAAALLRMSQSWVYKQVGANRMQHVRLGGNVRFTMAQIDAEIARRVRRPQQDRVARRGRPGPRTAL